MPGYGMGGHCGFAKESAWGTPVAVSSGDFFEALSETVTLAIDRFEVRNIVGGRYAEPDDYAGIRRIEGEIVFPAHPIHVGNLLRGALGLTSTITVIVSGELWESDFRPATTDDGVNNPVPPFTLEIFRDVTSANRYAGVQFGKLTLAVEPNQDLRVTAGLLAKTTSVIAKSTPTFPSSGINPFAFDTASVQFAGGAVNFVESLSLEFDNQLEGIPVLNASTDIARVRRSGFQTMRVSGTVGFEDLTEYNRFVQQSEANLVVSFTQVRSFGLILRVPRVVYTAFPLGISGRERLTVGFEGMGRFDTTLGYAIQARLTTTKSNF